MNGKLAPRFIVRRRVAEWLQAVNRREARRRAEAECEWRRMRRFFALLCGAMGVALIVLCWPGGCSLALGVALVLAGAALW